ncbi:hypothetical protein Tco_0704047 [Tanacetum coccineum]|uniref:Xylulose kinase-1 n=1 Tax=Tanacetum coccineum TaxID=301880 RepID=A0ABQ4Y225_9ASTR
MASLEFCSKHNMVAYLEKTDGNTEFHQIMDFLTCSSIYYALTVSPIVSTLFVEQFWTTAKSRTVNNTSYIDATVAGKPVTISEASIRSDLLFDDADGIDSLNNQAIFDTIQLMGNQLKDVPVLLDHFPVPTLTEKVLTFMVKKGKNFSGKVTPLFDYMLVQQIEDEGDASERPSDSPPIPSPPHPSEDQPQIQPDISPRPSHTTHIPNSIPEGSGGNHGAQAKEIKALKAHVKKLKKGVKPLITHHKSWMKTRLARKTSLKKKGVHKEYVSKQGRKSVKSFKGKPSAHKDLAFDDLDDIVDDTLNYMETKDAQDEGRISYVVLEEKENADKEVSTKAPVSTVKPNEGTDKKNEGKSATQTAPTTTSTPSSTPTPIMFGDDETIAQVLIIMSQNKEKLKEKEKGVEIRNIEDTKRPRPTSTRSILTLRPLPKIDPKDKGKKRIEEEDEFDTESEGKNKCRQEFLLRNSKRKKVRSLPSNQMSKNFFIDTIAAQGNSWLTKKTRKGYLLNKKAIEQGTKKRKSGNVKMISRKRPRPQPDDEHRNCLRIITFESTIDSEIMETKSFIARLHKVSSPDGNYLVVYRVNGHFRAFNYLMEVLHIFNRQDLFHLYDLVMKQYSEITPEDIELILWGDLKIILESSTEENDQGGGKQTHPSPSISSKINLGRRKMLGEMWDCQLGNLTDGKVSGEGGK